MKVIDLPWMPYGTGWIAGGKPLEGVYTVTKPIQGYGEGGYVAHCAWALPPTIHATADEAKQACQEHFSATVLSLLVPHE